MHRTSQSSAVRACAAFAVTGALAGCVTEIEHPKPRPLATTARTGPKQSSQPGARLVETVSTPVDPANTFNTQVAVLVKPIGVVEYDGLTPPIVSPDGRFIACQTGAAPEWATLLAEPGAPLPVDSTITVYQLDPDSGLLSRYAPPQAPPDGVLLGRMATDSDYLVERPQPDGSRWIGTVNWITGQVEYPVQGPDCNAHAVLLPGDVVAFTRRSAPEQHASLVIRPLRDPGASTRAELGGAGSHWCFPLPSASPDTLFAYEITPQATSLAVLRCNVHPAPARLSAIARHKISDSPSAMSAFQSSAPWRPPVQAPAATPGESREAGDWLSRSAAVFVPRSRQVAVCSSRGMMNLGTGASAATYIGANNLNGYLLSSSESLQFRSLDPDTNLVLGLAAPVFDGQWVGCAVRSNNYTAILFGPIVGQGGTRMRVFVVSLDPAKTAELNATPALKTDR